MRGAHGIASHRLQHTQPKILQAVGQRRAHARMILMVACALNLQRLAIQEEALLRIEDRRTHTKADALGIADFAVCIDRHNGRVEIGILH